MKCCFCGKEIEGYGNNPEGAMKEDKEGNIIDCEYTYEDRCCDECNMNYVIFGRLYKMGLFRLK